MRYLIIAILSSLVTGAWSQHIFDKNINNHLNNQMGFDQGLLLGTAFEVTPYINLNYPNVFLLFQYHDEFDKISGKLKEENIAGLMMNNYINVMPGLKLGKAKLGFTIRNKYEQQIEYTKDLFDLVHLGNSPLAGSNLNLSPFTVEAVQYQSVGVDFNFSTIKELKSFQKYGFSINILRGYSFYDLETDKASLFTSIQGDSIHASLAFKYRQNNPDNVEFYNTNGVGAGIDIYYYYESISGKNSFFLELNNLGFIQWDQQSKYFDFDTVLSYTGIDIISDNPFQDPDFFIDTFFDLENGGINEAYFHRLNPSLKFVYIRKMSENKSLYLGVDYFLNGLTTPGIYGSLRLSKERMYFQPGIYLDRYARPGLSFQYNFMIRDRVSINLASYHVEGFFYKFNGQSLLTSLQYSF